ncbi:hypothetical protein A2853_00235 [Candidatus Kaiserbacteria bacterium RIFCSPHIGHO2_01_FULL_55_17]|uniref:Uncharacterized protein n=1 Tax=Candidatus Kaiserbacteria bacterium RIFCSPHIGHO2_01_FULL_55_17 TaxID=1798484 RepID=A0A1F6DA93_9BACT|nr:MAG: hypothetical protein A2853_00235 [Candidatus Kaiserbacteria bacterium RIFCSPHIGHO2_01_FULL_55_17]
MIEANISENYRNKWTLALYWSMPFLVAIAALAFAVRGDWASAFATLFIGALMFVPPFLKGYYKVYLPFALELSIVAFIFLTLFLGWMANFYDRIPLWDKFLHFQSGLLLAATGYVLVYTLNEQRRERLALSPGFVSFFAFMFSVAMGALWEIIEYAADLVWPGNYWQGFGITDTMNDLLADAVGALIISIIGYFWMRRRARLPFTPRFLQVFKERLKKVAPLSIRKKN